MRGIGWAGGRGVAIRFVSSLVLESRRVGSMIDLTAGAQSGGLTRCTHTRPGGTLLGRRVERGSDERPRHDRCLRHFLGISSCRAIDRVAAVCQGRAVTVTGWGPRVVPGWGKGGPVNVVLSGSGGDGTNWVLCLPGAGPIDCHAAQRKWLCVPRKY